MLFNFLLENQYLYLLTTAFASALVVLICNFWKHDSSIHVQYVLLLFYEIIFCNCSRNVAWNCLSYRTNHLHSINNTVSFIGNYLYDVYQNNVFYWKTKFISFSENIIHPFFSLFEGRSVVFLIISLSQTSRCFLSHFLYWKDNHPLSLKIFTICFCFEIISKKYFTPAKKFPYKSLFAEEAKLWECWKIAFFWVNKTIKLD